MIQNEKCSDNNTVLENVPEHMSIVNIMKHGWHQTVNNAVCYYQTPINVALILEQESNYNNILREQESAEKAGNRIQNNMISEEKIIRPRMSVIKKEHM